MSSSQFLTVGTGVNVVDATTAYFPIAGKLENATTAAEANVLLPIRDAGTLSNLYVYIPTNTASNTSTITLRLNATTNTALTISVSGDQTGVKEDTSNSVSVAATDEATYIVVVPTEAGTNNLNISVLGMEFEPTTTTNCVQLMAATNGGNSGATGSTRFSGANGEGRVELANVKNRLEIRQTFTWSNLYTYISANTSSDSIVYAGYKNGAAGNQSVTYTTTQTGVKEDTSNTDSLVATDDIVYAQTYGAGLAGLVEWIIASRLVSTSNFFQLMASSINGAAVSFNVTTYSGCHGDLIFSTTIANSQIYPRFTFTASELGAYVSANTIATSDTTVDLMDNGLASAVTVSYAAAQTGLKNDSVNTTEITSGTDEVQYRVVTPNTSGSITLTWISVLGETTAPVSSIKTTDGLPVASTKTVDGLPIASMKTFNGLP